MISGELRERVNAMRGGQVISFTAVVVVSSERFEKLADRSPHVSEDGNLTWLLIDRPRQRKRQAPCCMTLNKTHPLWCLFGCLLRVLCIETVGCSGRSSLYTILDTVMWACSSS